MKYLWRLVMFCFGAAMFATCGAVIGYVLSAVSVTILDLLGIADPKLGVDILPLPGAIVGAACGLGVAWRVERRDLSLSPDADLRRLSERLDAVADALGWRPRL